MWDLIGAGWKGGFGTIRRNLPLFLCSYIVLLIIEAFNPRFRALHFALTHHGYANAYPVSLHDLFLNLIKTILVSVAVAPCMLAVHRYILLGENGGALKNAKRILFFTFWLIAVHTLPILIMAAKHRMPGAVILGLVSYYLIVRLVLSFPAIAIDLAQPLQDGWGRADGHWWQIFWTMLLGLAPIVIAVIPLAFMGNRFDNIILWPIFGLLLPVIAAALASELYRKFSGSMSSTLRDSGSRFQQA